MKGINKGGSMLWIIVILIVATTFLTQLGSKRLIKRHYYRTARLLVSGMLMIQLVLVYYFMKILVLYIIDLLNMFYNQ